MLSFRVVESDSELVLVSDGPVISDLREALGLSKKVSFWVESVNVGQVLLRKPPG